MVTPLMIEFLRMNFNQPGLLQKGGQYLATYGQNARPRDFPSPLGHKDILDLLHKLRYQSGETSTSAIKELQEHTTAFLGLPEITSEDLLQIDLVTEVSELWPIPFEATFDKRGKPLLLNPDRKVVLTRRRRGRPEMPRSTWDPHPRILFAWANPDWTKSDPVPHKKHLKALTNALTPWSEHLPGDPDVKPGLEKFLTVIKNTSADDIARACGEAQRKGRPFGYVHILAHGGTITDARGSHRECIGVCLESQTGKPTTPEGLSNAIHAGGARPSVVTLAVCGGAAQANPVVPARSLAQELHCDGVPIVVTSQLPLTFPGSTLMTESLYPGMIEGEDIRETLFDVRYRLFNEITDTHDWLSMVAYVRLPEDYEEVRAQRNIATLLGRLKTAQYWADHLLETQASDQNLADVEKRLSECIAKLAAEVQTDVVNRHQPLLLEALGLLGSAHKRRAELLFRWKPDRSEESKKDMIESRDWYSKANRKNLSHHWTGVQALSVHAVLDSRIDDGWWAGTAFAARQAYENNDLGIEDRMWACGTLAELQLLAACTELEHGGAMELARKYLREIVEAVHNSESGVEACDPYLIESTRRQLSRYVDWWTKSNGYFRDRESDLANEARQLIEYLSISSYKPKDET